MDQDILYTTAEGLKRFQQRIDALMQRYRAVVETNEEAAGAGDNSVWHDNFAYEENQRSMHALANAIQSAKKDLEKLRVVSPATTTYVTIGATVRILFNGSEEMTYTIGGYEDSDPAQNRISYMTPLGRLFLNKRVGEECELSIADKTHKYEIIDIFIESLG